MEERNGRGFGTEKAKKSCRARTFREGFDEDRKGTSGKQTNKQTDRIPRKLRGIWTPSERGLAVRTQGTRERKAQNKSWKRKGIRNRKRKELWEPCGAWREVQKQEPIALQQGQQATSLTILPAVLPSPPLALSFPLVSVGAEHIPRDRHK
ncbi:hypothetical protein Bbelb_172110 [Branchiostoma belcheri]|nr:hypothetical protein Bbelb_172110 [Branchiostoma belcheri]